MYRHRVVLDRSHRDGDAMIGVAHTVVPWYCGVCGEDNTDDDRFCWWCRADNGEWLCEKCGRRNRKIDEDCTECGTPKPEDD